MTGSYHSKVSIGFFGCAVSSLCFDWLDLNSFQPFIRSLIAQQHAIGSPLLVSWCYTLQKLYLVFDRLMLLLSVLFLCIVPTFQYFAL